MLWPWKKKEDKSASHIEIEKKLDTDEIKLTSNNIQKILGKNSDVQFKDIFINSEQGIKTTAIFVEGLVDSKAISQYVFAPLIDHPKFGQAKNEKEIVHYIQQGSIYFPVQNMRRNIGDTISDILAGYVALILDGSRIAFTFDTKGFEKRSIAEPTDENVIKGGKDSFVETLRVNTATVRRKIKSHNLIVDETIVGKQTLTPIAIVYMDGITNRHIVEEIKERLAAIDIDGALSTSFIDEYLINYKYTAFPQVLYTERPDKFCSNIIEGRVGLIIDGIASTLILPTTLLQFLQAPEDYAQIFIISSIIRLLRFAMMITTLYLPGFYVAITTFHQEMIPTELALSIQNSKQGVPFPSFIEVIGMLIAFEVLVEAGLRLPKTIGQAVSIVGAVVVGQAAVSAKLVSPAVVVIIATTAISSFTMPNQDFSNALRLWRFILVILSSVFGLFGLSMGGLILLYHLCRITNFGVPYMSPFVASENHQGWDTLFRLPIKYFKKRPYNLKTTNTKRQK